MRIVQTRVLIEVNEIGMLRRSYVKAFCEGCNRDVTLLSPSSAADLISVNTARIFLLMSAGRIHSQQNNEGMSLVCLPSLSLV